MPEISRKKDPCCCSRGGGRKKQQQRSREKITKIEANRKDWFWVELGEVIVRMEGQGTLPKIGGIGIRYSELNLETQAKATSKSTGNR
ncbi:MAG: hypothetical protein ACXABG_17060 [Promethearchaeota archaeon]|jgi:hypothetical protein